MDVLYADVRIVVVTKSSPLLRNFTRLKVPSNAHGGGQDGSGLPTRRP